MGLGPLLNLAQDMLCVAGVDGYIRQVNPAWERALGWTAEELYRVPPDASVRGRNRSGDALG